MDTRKRSTISYNVWMLVQVEVTKSEDEDQQEDFYDLQLQEEIDHLERIINRRGVLIKEIIERSKIEATKDIFKRAQERSNENLVWDTLADVEFGETS